MTLDFATYMMSETLKVIALTAAPALLAGLMVGILVGVLQAVTQIHEMTLTFIPKMIAVALALLFFSPWMLRTFTDFAREVFLNFPSWIR